MTTVTETKMSIDKMLDLLETGNLKITRRHEKLPSLQAELTIGDRLTGITLRIVGNSMDEITHGITAKLEDLNISLRSQEEMEF